MGGKCKSVTLQSNGNIARMTIIPLHALIIHQEFRSLLQTNAETQPMYVYSELVTLLRNSPLFGRGDVS